MFIDLKFYDFCQDEFEAIGWTEDSYVHGPGFFVVNPNFAELSKVSQDYCPEDLEYSFNIYCPTPPVIPDLRK